MKNKHLPNTSCCQSRSLESTDILTGNKDNQNEAEPVEDDVDWNQGPTQPNSPTRYEVLSQPLEGLYAILSQKKEDVEAPLGLKEPPKDSHNPKKRSLCDSGSSKDGYIKAGTKTYSYEK